MLLYKRNDRIILVENNMLATIVSYFSRNIYEKEYGYSCSAKDSPYLFAVFEEDILRLATPEDIAIDKIRGGSWDQS